MCITRTRPNLLIFWNWTPKNNRIGSNVYIFEKWHKSAKSRHPTVQRLFVSCFWPIQYVNFQDHISVYSLFQYFTLSAQVAPNSPPSPSHLPIIFIFHSHSVSFSLPLFRHEPPIFFLFLSFPRLYYHTRISLLVPLHVSPSLPILFSRPLLQSPLNCIISPYFMPFRTYRYSSSLGFVTPFLSFC